MSPHLPFNVQTGGHRVGWSVEECLERPIYHNEARMVKQQAWAGG